MMLFLSWAVIALTPQDVDRDQAAAFVEKLRVAAKSAKFENLRTMFSSPSYSRYLETMVGPQLSLRSIGISAFPAPPGFEKFGDYWVVFHRYQEVESDHDCVFPIIRTGEGPILGSEIPVDLTTAYKFSDLKFDVKLLPAASKVSITTVCNVKRSSDGPPTVLMRMNDAYTVQAAKYNGKPIDIIVNQELPKAKLDSKKTQLLQSGSVLYVTNSSQGGKLELGYEASLNIRGLDKTTADFMLLTSYWYPSIGLQPAPSHTTISGPKDWLLKGNGNLVSEKVNGELKTSEYQNDVPISWYHVVAGPYQMAYEVKDRGRTFRTWHLGTVDAARAKHDAEMARDAVAFFEDRFGKFPYNGYDVVDTPDFYGVECYSFTLLTPRITSWATSHEIGHTYFGGLVPNTYLHSIWNEGMTQYVDSSQFKKNGDNTLNSGYGMRKVKVALTDFFLAHGPHGNVGYFRGAYTMKMLENELGLDLMNTCLRQLVKERVGKVTEWSDIEKSFAATAGRPLAWFFDQWVRGSEFPTIAMDRSFVENGPNGGFNTNLVFSQRGTPLPFRLKFEVVIDMPDGAKRFPITMTKRQEQFDLSTVQRPSRITVNTFGWTLADGPPPVTPNGPNLARR